VGGYPTAVIALALKRFIVSDDTSAMIFGYSTDVTSTGEDLG
jgi:hypothetical protein